jgi:hypothetical protein
MGMFSRLEELLGRSLEDLQPGPDADTMLTAAMAQLEQEALQAAQRQDQLRRDARQRDEFHALRQEEATHLRNRAAHARGLQLPEEAQRLETAAGRAETDAVTHRDAASSARSEADALEGAVKALRLALTEAQTRHQTVKEHLKHVRAATGHHRVDPAPSASASSASAAGSASSAERPEPNDAQAPPQPTPVDFSTLHGEDRRRAARDAFDRLERDHGVEDLLTQLKRRAGKV